MSSKRTAESSTVFENPVKILYILIPLILSTVIGVSTMGLSDTVYVIRWIMIMMIFGLAFFPLAAFIFRKSTSSGFFFGQILGILLVALTSWTLGHIGLPFNQITIALILGIGTVICYGCTPLRINLIRKLNTNNTIEHVALEEVVFAVCLTILCYYKGFLPDINGQEKFMDYGYIMSMVRSSSLPANDMWLSGYSINYYYFGQFIYALLIKLGGIRTSVGYNIAMCCAIAVPFTMSYGIGTYLIDTAKSFGLKTVRFVNIICGIICGFTTTIFGNSHSFFYDENSAGNGILHLFQKMGVNVGKTDAFFYPESTRFIGHNPDSALIEGIKNGGDYTIEEFPFYSFLVGDLHAHVCSTMVVLTIIALCIAFIGRYSDVAPGEKRFMKLPVISWERLPEGFSVKEEFVSRLKTEWKKNLTIEVIFIGILLGITQMTNYWDFLIYFIFCAMVLLVVTTRKSNDFSTVPGAIIFALVLFDILALYLGFSGSPLLHVALQLVVLAVAYLATCYAPCALSRTALGMSFFFTAAHIVALSFNLTFDMISNTLAACQNHSSLFQLWILYGTHIFIGVAFIVFTIIGKNYTTVKAGKSRKVVTYGTPSDGYPNPISRFFCERNIIDILVCGMVIVGILLIIAPEIFYVRDIYTGGYLRSNTMFKFTYAAFIILSLTIGYAIIRLLFVVNKKGDYAGVNFVASIIFIVMLIVPAHYTGVSLSQRCGEINKKNYKGIDGVNYINTFASSYTYEYASGNLLPYLHAINWFNEYVPGTPVILETYGESYTDYDIVSAYTGLQTVCGWQTHEQLWRFHGVVDPETNLLVDDPEHNVWDIYLTPRHTDITTAYTNSDAGEVQAIIDRYNIEYIVLGEMEMKRFGVDNSAVFASLGEVVFSEEGITVYQVHPATSA